MSKSYRIGFGFIGKLAVVTAIGVTLAGGVAMAEAKGNAVYAAANQPVVQLEPVQVTISAARFDAIQAETQATAVASR